MMSLAAELTMQDGCGYVLVVKSKDDSKSGWFGCKRGVNKSRVHTCSTKSDLIIASFQVVELGTVWPCLLSSRATRQRHRWAWEVKGGHVKSSRNCVWLWPVSADGLELRMLETSWFLSNLAWREELCQAETEAKSSLKVPFFSGNIVKLDGNAALQRVDEQRSVWNRRCLRVLF